MKFSMEVSPEIHRPPSKRPDIPALDHGRFHKSEP